MKHDWKRLSEILGFPLALMLFFLDVCFNSRRELLLLIIPLALLGCNRHDNPLCWCCKSEYERGGDDRMVKLMEKLEEEKFAEFDPITREWKPVRVVSLESLMREEGK